jgi:hypothetical protein
MPHICTQAPPMVKEMGISGHIPSTYDPNLALDVDARA